MANLRFSHILLFSFLLNLLVVRVRSERQVPFEMGDNLGKDTLLGNVAELAGFRVPLGGFKRVLIDSLPPIASEFFIVNERSELRIRKSLDRDAVCARLICCDTPTCSISFKVFITMAGKNSVIDPATVDSLKEDVLVMVTLRDENDNGPRFTSETVSLLETTKIGQKISLPKATDKDSPSNGVKTYRLTDPTFTFELDGPGPEPVMRVMKALDREKQKSYDLTYEAIDGGAPPRKGRITLRILIQDVNDNAPKFAASSQTVKLREDVGVNTKVAQLTSTDEDEGDNGKVSYRITSDSRPTGLVSSLFTIDSATGEVRVLKHLDFEDPRQAGGFTLYILASDQGKPKRSSTATLRVVLEDVNDNDPQISLDPPNPVIVEGDPSDKLVALVTVTDADEVSRSKLKCSLLHGNGFRLAPISSVLLDLITTREFDHEIESSVKITFSCEDRAEPRKTINKSFRINITDRNDNPPVFQPPTPRIVVISEAWEAGREILRVRATDADQPHQSLLYSLDAVGMKNFQIHRDTGRIFLKRRLDREAKDRHTFYVIATDRGAPPRNGSLQVTVTVTDVNDNPPRYRGPTTFHVPEGTRRNTLVARLQFEDPDQALNGTWRTSLSVKANVANTMFKVSHVGDLLTRNEIDREAHENLHLDVVATDQGFPALSTTVALSLIITDVNDNTPQLIAPNPGAILGNSPPLYASAAWNTTIARLRGRDPDFGRNGTFDFRLVRTNATGLVALEPHSGRLYTTWSEGTARSGLFYLTVQLRDRGSPPLSSETTVYLHIGKSGPLDRLRGAAVNNIVILALIIVCSVALAISLIVAIVWARSRIANNGHDPNDPYAHYETRFKVPEESLSEHNMDDDEPRPPLANHRMSDSGTFKHVAVSEDGEYLGSFQLTIPRNGGKPAPMQTFSQPQLRPVVTYTTVPSSLNGTLPRATDQHRHLPMTPERMHLRRLSDASNEDSGKGGSDDNLSKCSVNNPPSGLGGGPRVAMYVRRPNQEGTMC